MPRALANFYIILRYSLGDFTFAALQDLSLFESNVFWIIWTLIVILTYIIFLNFIIAEIGASYSDIQDSVDEYIDQ